MKLIWGTVRGPDPATQPATRLQRVDMEKGVSFVAVVRSLLNSTRIVYPVHWQVGLTVLGKAEGEGQKWHGHVTAVTVASECRRMGLASKLMQTLEDTTDKLHNAFFVDLFVRKSNQIAIQMYQRMGYSVYKEVIGYYSSKENAYDMRKAMPRDVQKESVVPLAKPVRPEDLEFD